METEVSKSKFKVNAFEILRQVETSDEPVFITDHGKRVLIVRKYTSSSESARDKLKGSVLRYDAPFAPVAANDWEA